MFDIALLLIANTLLNGLMFLLGHRAAVSARTGQPLIRRPGRVQIDDIEAPARRHDMNVGDL
jgi:uncharacterized protein YcaQ